MKELITRGQADLLLTALPLLGLVAGGVGYALRKTPAWLAVAGGSLLIGVLWRVYNAIADRLGLDSLAQLGINAALFVAVGIGAGRAWRIVSEKRP